jgi:hypothetical protein
MNRFVSPKKQNIITSDDHILIIGGGDCSCILDFLLAKNVYILEKNEELINKCNEYKKNNIVIIKSLNGVTFNTIYSNDPEVVYTLLKEHSTLFDNVQKIIMRKKAHLLLENIIKESFSSNLNSTYNIWTRKVLFVEKKKEPVVQKNIYVGPDPRLVVNRHTIKKSNLSISKSNQKSGPKLEQLKEKTRVIKPDEQFLPQIVNNNITITNNSKETNRINLSNEKNTINYPENLHHFTQTENVTLKINNIKTEKQLHFEEPKISQTNIMQNAVVTCDIKTNQKTSQIVNKNIINSTPTSNIINDKNNNYIPVNYNKTIKITGRVKNINRPIYRPVNQMVVLENKLNGLEKQIEKLQSTKYAEEPLSFSRDIQSLPQTQEPTVIECVPRMKLLSKINVEMTVPASEPIIESVPVSEPIVEVIPVSEPIVETIPVSEPIVESTPASEPIVESTPVSEPIETELSEFIPIGEPEPDVFNEFIPIGKKQRRRKQKN